MGKNIKHTVAITNSMTDYSLTAIGLMLILLKDLFVNKLSSEFGSHLPVINPGGREFNVFSVAL